MDKNTITGLALIFLVVIGFGYFNKPSQEEIENYKHQQDSIAQVEREAHIQAEKAKAKELTTLNAADHSISDSVRAERLNDAYGTFANAAIGNETFTTLENNLMKVKISSKGGRIYSVELKDYKTNTGEPLILFDGDDNKFGLNFYALNRKIATNDLYFQGDAATSIVSVSGPKVDEGKEGNEKYNAENAGESKSVTMRLDGDNGSSIGYRYTIKHNSYKIGFDLNTVNFGALTNSVKNVVDLTWSIDMPRQEKISKYGEDNYTTAFYKMTDDESVENLSTTQSEEEALTGKVEWIAFKQLFFSNVLINEDGFAKANIKVTQQPENPTHLASFDSNFGIDLGESKDAMVNMEFYFGPNHYRTLKLAGHQMHDLIDLGWGIFGWINQVAVIPVFNFLKNYIGSFGLIILILTILIKLVIFPFTYKSYQSQAKMKALKPELEEIQNKHGKDKPMETQQATMELYKKAGVNPLGGCLPMLFQMPILFAMFRFFPASIELRQKSFLWATDLSAYDSILSLPFTIPFYGDHVSLFCLLMAVTNILYMKTNSDMNASANQQMPAMKYMMYMMPVMMLVFFNNYASGLSYYYFVSTLFTVGQTQIFKMMVNEDAIRAQINVNKKKPAKKSKFQQRLEEMQRKQNKKK